MVRGRHRSLTTTAYPACRASLRQGGQYDIVFAQYQAGRARFQTWAAAYAACNHYFFGQPKELPSTLHALGTRWTPVQYPNPFPYVTGFCSRA